MHLDVKPITCYDLLVSFHVQLALWYGRSTYGLVDQLSILVVCVHKISTWVPGTCVNLVTKDSYNIKALCGWIRGVHCRLGPAIHWGEMSKLDEG